jgi:uncharacterized protein YndB with AHSA1/START domain
MSEQDADEQTSELVFEVDLDAPPDKVWRALSIPELRERWLPGALADAEPESSSPGADICYRLRDKEPPFLESVVTFEVAPNEAGGATLRITQRLTDARLTKRPPAAVNDNGGALTLAA